MASRGEGSLRRPQEAANDSELAFLVTHWLRNFNQTNGSNAAASPNDATTMDDRSKREALERIQRATSDLASAFSALGTFGTATAVSARQSKKVELRSIRTERYDFCVES